MTSDSKIQQTTAAPKTADTSPLSGTKKTDEAASAVPNRSSIGQQEFLSLLVHQLQNQDPLNPMDGQEFAVQLAQFSSLEQLISINKKIDGGTGSISSMASFLGHEVVLKGQGLEVKNGKGPNLMVDIPDGAQSARIDLLNEEGRVVGSKVIEGIEPGRQVIRLAEVDLPDGNYSSRFVVVDQSGKFVELEAKVTGTVEGFVAEPTPALLVNGQQVAMEDVVEVYLGSAG